MEGDRVGSFCAGARMARVGVVWCALAGVGGEPQRTGRTRRFFWDGELWGIWGNRVEGRVSVSLVLSHGRGAEVREEGAGGRLGGGCGWLRAWCLYLKGWWCAGVMKILRKSRFLGGK